MTSTEIRPQRFVAPEPHLDTKTLGLIGAGPLARAVGRLLLIGGTRVRMYARRPEAQRALTEQVPGLEAVDSLAAALERAGTLFIAVPASELDEVSARIAPHVLPDQIVLVASRGVTEGFRMAHEHIRAHTCLRKIGILGGPLHARELEAGRRINVVIASRFSEVPRRVAMLTGGAPVAYHPTTDVVGVEVAGAVANVASLAAGMAEGLDLGGTARGVLLARGIIEARALGRTLGASAETFTGLAGLGEMIPRSVTSMDRHLELGRLVARGTPSHEALQVVSGHVEGVTTAREGRARGIALGLELPLVSTVAGILDGTHDPRSSLEAILARPLPLDDA